MDMAQSDFEKLLFFETARKEAEETYAKNPLDADNLMRWGGALLELSQFQSASDGIKYLQDAESKLEEALQVNPNKHEALWCLGNALTSHGFVIQDIDIARVYFDKANKCFEQAAELDPGNEMYLKSMEITAKAPELHVELHKHAASQQATQAAATSSNVKGSKKKNKKKQNNDLKYDILGWVVLAVGIIAWVGMAKSHVPVPPPNPR